MAKDVRSFRLTPWWALPVLVLLAFVVHWQDLDQSPFSDDHSAIWNSGASDIPWRSSFFRPISDLSFRIGHLISGTSAVGHRAFNVALHGLNAFLLLLLSTRVAVLWGSTRRLNAAMLGALLFLVYPFHQESILWLVGRESSLGMCFVLLGLLSLMGEGAVRSRIGGSAVALFLGLLCYEGAIILPLLAFALLAFDLLQRRTPLRPQLVGYGVAGFLYFLLMRASGAAAEDAYVAAMLPEGLSGLLSNIPKVGARLFLPPADDPDTMVQRAVVLLILLAVLVVLVRRALRNDQAERYTVLTMLLLLVLSCSVAVIGGVSTRTSESDRFLYLPSAFLCGLLGLLIGQIPRTVIRLGTAAATLVLFAALMEQEVQHWRVASAETKRIMRELPTAPENGILFVSGLPDSHGGAYIFRNGFREAVALDGRSPERYVDVKEAPHPGAVVHFRGEAFVFGPDDRWTEWTDNGFVDH